MIGSRFRRWVDHRRAERQWRAYERGVLDGMFGLPPAPSTKGAFDPEYPSYAHGFRVGQEKRKMRLLRDDVLNSGRGK